MRDIEDSNYQPYNEESKGCYPSNGIMLAACANGKQYQYTFGVSCDERSTNRPGQQKPTEDGADAHSTRYKNYAS